MSRFLTVSLLALAACDEALYTYTVDAEIVVPAEVAAELETPALVEAEWMGEVHGLELICEPLEGEHRVNFEHTVETVAHASHQLFSARVVPWPADQPCDPSLIGQLAPEGEGPYAHVFLFDDDAQALGGRQRERAESVTVEVGWGG